MSSRLLLLGLVSAALVSAGCGSGSSDNGAPQMPRAAAFARHQLARAGWTVNTVLTGHSTRICGGTTQRVVLDVSANELHLSGGVALEHPHLSAWLFPDRRLAVACLKGYIRGAGASPKPGDGVEQAFKTLGQSHLAEQVHGYFILTSSNGSPAELRRASERAFAGMRDGTS